MSHEIDFSSRDKKKKQGFGFKNSNPLIKLKFFLNVRLVFRYLTKI